MSNLYINENGAVVGVSDGKCQITKGGEVIDSIPVNTLDGITILGKSQLTTQMVEYCLTNGIAVSYFSKGGKYFGRLESGEHANATRQRLQCKLYEEDFAMKFSKNIVAAKIYNQKVVLNRYAVSRDIDCDDNIKNINILKKKAESAKTFSDLGGYEGMAARLYFEGLGKCVDEEFTFSKRSRRPPKDEFNSMIGLGYTILIREIQCQLESHGLNAYLGFMHRDRYNAPSLACDLVEEWRAIIVDATVMSLISRHMIHKEHFDRDSEAVYLNREGCKIFLNWLERKLNTKIQYIAGVESMDFRHAIDAQIISLIDAMDNNDAGLYQPIRVR